MKRRITLTESQLRKIVENATRRIVQEYEQNVDGNTENQEELEEGWLNDKWNQTKSAFNTMTQRNGNSDMGIKDMFQAAKKNWNTQGELNGLNDLIEKLSKFIDSGNIDPQMTIGQLIGGKYNNNKFDKMSAIANNRKAQIKRRGGNFYE